MGSSSLHGCMGECMGVTCYCPLSAAAPSFSAASSSERASPPLPSHAPAWRVAAGNLAAGAVAGCAVEAALYPIDTIKTRMQAMVGGGGIRALLSSGGGKGLYAGVYQNLAGVAPSSAIFISVYEPMKRRAMEQYLSPDRAYLAPLVAGAAAGTCASFIRVPTEVIKSRLQTKEFTGAVQAVSGAVGPGRKHRCSRIHLTPLLCAARAPHTGALHHYSRGRDGPLRRLRSFHAPGPSL
jgi:hypothetical protein